ncbi:MAG: glycosyltransferase [Candidatus Omnitrophica bacterium]|nr:glycosyltransferase [Candidatus Omnitrophota bacterium]
MKKDHVSIIIVNFNGRGYLERCLSTAMEQKFDRERYEVIMVDNGSTDGSVEYVRKMFEKVKIIRSNKNNFAYACNLGVKEAEGDYCLLANNDMSFSPLWLGELFRVISERPDAGAVQSKILLENGKINSLGVMETGHRYFKDIGFGEEDTSDGRVRSVGYISGGATLFRKELIEKAGLFDEDFIMYVEDVDMSYRLKQAGYTLLVNPKSWAHHRYRGTGGAGLSAYFCSRNRYGFIAKHFPAEFKQSFDHCQYFIGKRKKEFYRAAQFGIYKLYKHHPAVITDPQYQDAVKRSMAVLLGRDDVDRLFRQVETCFSLRRPKIGIFDQVIHLIGGGQKLNAQIARSLQDDYEVDMLGVKDFDLSQILERDGIDLRKSSYVKVDIGYEKNDKADLFDPGMVAPPEKNYYEEVSRQSSRYDIFVNGNMLPQVSPRSPFSVFFCHFPDMNKTDYFYVDEYTKILANSSYTAGHIEERWRLSPDAVVYPPVDAFYREREKKNVILSVARFEPGGTKKQLEMIQAFNELCRSVKKVREEWTLCLVGGAARTIYLDKLVGNTYLAQVRDAVRKSEFKDRISLKVDLPVSDLKKIMAESRIFWHLCGLGATEPRDVEHFGMAVVEAMQNRVVPIAFNGGGQREVISENGKNGFLIKSLRELKEVTLCLIDDPRRMSLVAAASFERSKVFSYQNFSGRIRSLIEGLTREFSVVVRDTVEEEVGPLPASEAPVNVTPGETEKKGTSHKAAREFVSSAMGGLRLAVNRADTFRLAMDETKTVLERLVKKMIHLPLRFYTFRQSAFNEAITGVTTVLAERMIRINEEISTIREELQALSAEHEKLRKAIDDRETHSADIRADYERLKYAYTQLELRLKRMQEESAFMTKDIER